MHPNITRDKTTGLFIRSVTEIKFFITLPKVQVAKVAEPAEGEAEDHLGLQDSLPGCHVPTRRQEDHLRRH